jgi:hypothetical protein
VRRIFADYMGGLSPRTIARALNTAGGPGPRGLRWTASLLLGNALRETGILRNRLYIGELVWNRQNFIKDPTCGKRVARPNPKSAWIVEPVPALRVIEPTSWHAVQDRLEAASQTVTGRRAGAIGGDHETGQSGNQGGRLAALRRAPLAALGVGPVRPVRWRDDGRRSRWPSRLRQSS